MLLGTFYSALPSRPFRLPLNRRVNPFARIWDAQILPALSIDPRTLALFRAALGLLLLTNTLGALMQAEAWFSDDGVLPRSWITAAGEHWRWSLHLINGQLWFQLLLLLAQALAALALIVGLRSRWAALTAWVLSVSLANRNPLLLGVGDVLMLCLLFWSLWLPVGARWSVDHALGRDKVVARPSAWVSAGVLLQVLAVFWFEAAAMSAGHLWPQGLALRDLGDLEQIATPLGAWLFGPSSWLATLTRGVYLTLWLAPLLALLPVKSPLPRLAALLALATLSLGLLLTTTLNFEAWAALTALVLLIPSPLWDRADRRLASGSRAGALRIYYDEDCGFCRRSCLLLKEFLILPRAEILFVETSARARALRHSNNSWVVIDAQDTAHMHWDAWVTLLRRSAWLSLLAPLAALPPLSRLGHQLYYWTVRHRATLGRWTAFLEPAATLHTASPAAPRWHARLAAFALVMTLLWNCASVGWLPTAVQAALRPPMYLLRLDQHWDLLARTADADDGWLVTSGLLVDGREIDAASGRLKPVDFTTPRRSAAARLGPRWRHYQQQLGMPGHEGYRQHWARYLCTQWNARHGARNEQMRSLQLVYVLRDDRRSPSAVEQQVLPRYDCAGSAG